MKALLSIPLVYSAFQNLVGANKLRRFYADIHLRAKPNMKVLDIGCGPADILNFLPSLDYTGLDLSEPYITAAKKKHHSNNTFLCADVNHLIETIMGKFDLIMAIGLLHHLDDQTVKTLISSVHKLLANGGRFVTIDGCYTEKQSILTKFMLNNDRGKFVRSEPDYIKLVSSTGLSVKSHIYHSLLNIPYTHIVMELLNTTPHQCII